MEGAAGAGVQRQDHLHHIGLAVHLDIAGCDLIEGAAKRFQLGALAFACHCLAPHAAGAGMDILPGRVAGFFRQHFRVEKTDGSIYLAQTGHLLFGLLACQILLGKFGHGVAPIITR